MRIKALALFLVIFSPISVDNIKWGFVYPDGVDPE